jgi:hypothetical protein
MPLARMLTLAALAASFTVATRAPADQSTKVACVRANEEGQDLRRDGKLLEARDRFTSCATPSCPTILRQDCIVRRDEAQRAIPATRLIVTDSGGARLSNASITVDGIEAARRPDDVIEGGEHSFEVSLSGHGSVVQRLALGEGDGRRDETVVMKSTEQPGPQASTRHPYRIAALARSGLGQ